MSTPATSSMGRQLFGQNQASGQPRRFDVDKLIDSIRNVATVSELLRFLGAAVIVASMSLFLLQGWGEGNDIRRYLMLLAQTGLLAGGGFAMSYVLKEAKGARIFFGLALVSVTANFTILGALIYSVFQLDHALTTYPGFATWQIADIAGTGLVTLGALVVLVPIALFCFMVMATQSAKDLTLAFVPLARRQGAGFPNRHKVLASLLDVASLPAALVLAIALAVSLQTLGIPLLAPLTGLLYAAMAVDVLRRTQSNVVAGFTAFTAAFAIAIGFSVAVVVGPSLLVALVSLAAGIMLGLTGSWLHSRSAMIAGVLTMLAAVTFGFDAFVELVVASNWITLAVIGATAIALGSLLERHGVAIKLAVLQRANVLPHIREEAVLDD